ncbi:ABC transporter permease [Pseudonocardia alaniniphila]|uniref:ABC transporter permease n=1 Tax=Pseudonocardia alaniniphila TaxID=75291 RepID=A0ABS9TTF2_9PSEU|nr:ABC transporter permease [Pseudonocardia alaniniphila]MCH6171531.1 ABC transporter permease [Pseudonocardia alaniniphila]
MTDPSGPLLLEEAADSVAPPPAATASRWQRIRRRFLRRKLAMLGLVLVTAFVLLAVIGPLLTGDPEEQDFSTTLAGPSAAHLLGTDDLGRDVLSRIAHGAQVSLLAGVLSTTLALLLGVPIGFLAGFYRGWLDPVIMRINDVLLAFPFLVFAVGLAAILGASLRNVVIALAVAQIPAVVRIARGEALMLRDQDFVAGAIADGARDSTILARYILPNTMNVLIVQATVAIPGAIIGEATLSFLGLGVQPPTPSWGTMLTDAQQYLSQAPQLALFPGLAIAMATLGFNLLGDGLRDVLDPRSTR